MFDQPTAIFAAVVLGFAGTGVAMGLPLLVGSMAESLGFSDQQLGLLASSDMAGLFVGSVLTSFLVTRVNRRYLAAAGLFLVILGNYFSTQSPELVPLMLNRFCAGIGAGVCYSTCTASLAGSHNSARTFSILLFVLVVMNAFIFYVFPIIDGKWGVNGLFMFYLLEAVPILLILPLLPRYRYPETGGESDEVVLEGEADASETRLHIPEILPRLCLAAVFSFYILVGAYWAFIERAGVAVNISTDFISGTLTWGQIFSISGTALAVWLARRFGQSKPLLFALMMMVLTMLVLAGRVDKITFVFSVFSFSFFWIFIDVFQLGTLSNIDHSGRYAALVPACQGVAQAIAPSLAGILLSYQLGYSAVMMMCALAAALALCIYVYVYRKLLRVAPEIADAD
jgi:predicted MFS family arabinose efflux permease